jgi:hypothetical protein
MDRGRHTTSARDRPANLCLDIHTYYIFMCATSLETNKANDLLWERPRFLAIFDLPKVLSLLEACFDLIFT